MCLIIDKPKGLTLPLTVLEDMVSYNQDGFGLMWYSKCVKVYKTAVSCPMDLFLRLKELENHRVLIHLRMRTHGAINNENTHPYPTQNGGWLMHNGVLHNSGGLSKQGMSDTYHYIKDYINPCIEVVNNPAFVRLVENDIGASNKFVHMDKAGQVTYFNENKFVALVSEDFSVSFPTVKVSNTYAWSYCDNWYGGGMHHLEKPKKSSTPSVEVLKFVDSTIEELKEMDLHTLFGLLEACCFFLYEQEYSNILEDVPELYADWVEYYENIDEEEFWNTVWAVGSEIYAIIN